MKLLKFKSSTIEQGLGISKNRYDPERDGISPSLLSKWKECREKARLSLIGWTRRASTTPQLFGTICHAVLETIYGDIQRGKLTTIPPTSYVRKVVKKVDLRWRRDNPRADSDTTTAMEMILLLVEAIMPIYFTFWNKDLTRMDWEHLEQFVGHERENRKFGKWFSHMRGKLDGAFRVKGSARLWLFETKTKSRIGEQGESNLIDIMPLESQTHLYLGALQDIRQQVPGGVLLNIIRRPSLKLKKRETLMGFRDRVVRDIQRRPDWYFMRIRMEISGKDLVTQRGRLDAQFTDFLAWYHGEAPHYHNSDACENKYGTCDFLKICARKDYTGFYQRKPRRGEAEAS